MSLPVILGAEAQEEFDDSFDYYEQQQSGLGVRFAAEVRFALTHIAVNPRIHSVAFLDIRKAVVNTFPYCIFYTIEENSVAVLSIFHTCRDPNIWKGRR